VAARVNRESEAVVNRRQLQGTVAGLVLACAGALAPAARAKVTIDLDYSLDLNGFFQPKATNPFGYDGDAAKAALQRAANTFQDRFVDRLNAITPRTGQFGIQYTWTPSLFDPANGSQHTFDNPPIAAGVIKIYVGGRDLPGSTLGQGGPGGYANASGLQEWFDEIDGRGQPGALDSASPHTDFSPWGGSIAFDTATNWHLGLTTTGLTVSKSDFFSVALHEMAHLLGFGTAQSWRDAVVGGQFTGAKASALKGGPVQLSPDQAHWLNGTPSTVGVGGPQQETVMDPSLTVGTRKRFTLLDWAGLDDLGWEIAGPGDATADGAVNFEDLVALAQNYNTTTGLMRWSQGDFTEDGNVDFADLVLLAQNYNTGTPVGAAPELAAAYGGAFASDWRAAQAIAEAGVPEPASVGVLLIGVGLVVRRRRA
jgi:hypothetical protein